MTTSQSFSFRVSAGQRAALLILSGLLIGLFGMILYLVASSPLGVGLFLVWAVLLAVIIALVLLILGETAAAMRLRIAAGATDLHLRLPRRRGHVMLPPVAESVPLARITAVEMRHEMFSQFGIVAIQQAYRLLLSDGRSIELGADRQMKQPVFGRAAQAIAGRAGVSIRERGMVQGKPGVLAAWRTSVPDWSTPSLPGALVETMLARSARTFGILAASLTILSIIRMLTRG